MEYIVVRIADRPEVEADVLINGVPNGKTGALLTLGEPGWISVSVDMPAEMRTVRQQLRHSVDTRLKEPHFWVKLLADLDYHHTKLEDVEGLLDALLAYSKAEVAAAVKQTVQAARFAAVVGVPVEDCKTEKAACGARSAEHSP